jgi:hypothetical protein
MMLMIFTDMVAHSSHDAVQVDVPEIREVEDEVCQLNLALIEMTIKGPSLGIQHCANARVDRIMKALERVRMMYLGKRFVENDPDGSEVAQFYAKGVEMVPTEYSPGFVPGGQGPVTTGEGVKSGEWFKYQDRHGMWRWSVVP